jgi:epoxyqueuosine reductase
MPTLAEQIKERARALGFELVGIAPAMSPPGVEPLREWLEHGHAGEMAYMSRHAAAREHPRSILADVKSVVMVGMNYKQVPLAPSGGEGSGVRGAGLATANPVTPNPSLPSEERGERRTGQIASYARGRDYHDVLRERLKSLLAWLQVELPHVHGRVVVDTAPLLERDFARLSGLGWFGKNTMLLNTRLGSFFFLGGLLLDVELPADEPFSTSHCGTCTACLDACPTRAFTAPFELDARRCISYLTIELRGPIPEELRDGMGSWIFGCDICQDVCPWNRKAPLGREPAFQPRPGMEQPDLIELLSLSPAEFRERFGDTALSRPRRAGLLRNVAIALGNQGEPPAIPALTQALEDPEPLVREAAAWALGKLGARHTALASEPPALAGGGAPSSPR